MSMLDVIPKIVADAATTAAATGFTPAEALLAVLGPFATLISTLGGLFLKRHFRHLDAIEADLKARTQAEIARAKVDAEIAAELRLSRESREAHGKRLTELEDKLAAKIDDQRMQDLRERVQELHTEVVAGGVGVGAQLGPAPEDAPRVRARAPSVPDVPPSRKSFGSRV